MELNGKTQELDTAKAQLIEKQQELDKVEMELTVQLIEKQEELDTVKSQLIEKQNKLLEKKKQLMQDEGGVQKIKSVTRAIVRWGKDNGGMDVDQISDETCPSDLLKYIDKTAKSFQEKEKPEQLCKIIKRLKKLAKSDLGCP